jgi:glycosyltransferase involved in cell wall biosynthesis
MIGVSIVLTSFNRDHLLIHGLESIARQKYNNLEVIVVNDGLPNNTEEITKKYGFKYIYTGERNLTNPYWRAPCIPINIGVKNSTKEILILSCAEMYHLQYNTIELLTQPIQINKKYLCIPKGKDDVKGNYLNILNRAGHSIKELNKCNKLNTKLPFLLAMYKQYFLDLGGYDEDLSKGMSYDDDDIVNRLLNYGCEYKETLAECVHLFHDRSTPTKRDAGRFQYNKTVYESRKGILIRNNIKVGTNENLVGYAT